MTPNNNSYLHYRNSHGGLLKKEIQPKPESLIRIKEASRRNPK